METEYTPSNHPLDPDAVRRQVETVMPDARVAVEYDPTVDGYFIRVDQRFASQAFLTTDTLLHNRAHDTVAYAVEEGLGAIQRLAVKAFGLDDYMARRVNQLEAELQKAQAELENSKAETEEAREEMRQLRNAFLTTLTRPRVE